MKESQAQTCLAAWPSTKDRRLPGWVSASSPLVCGLATCGATAAIFRMAVLCNSIGFAILLTFVSSFFSLLIPALMPSAAMPYSRMVRGIANSIRKNSGTIFMLCGGPGLALAITFVLLAVPEIGIGLVTIATVVGAALGALLVDHLGLGWTTTKVIPILVWPALVCLTLGVSLVSFDQLSSPDECVTSWRRLPAWLGVSATAGTLFSLQHASNAELARFMGNSFRAVCCSQLLALLSLIALLSMAGAELLDWHAISIPLSVEFGSMTFLSAMLVPLALLTGAHCSPFGALPTHGGSLLAFGALAAVLECFRLTSLPARPAGDWAQLAGALLSIGACAILVFLRACSTGRQPLTVVPSRKRSEFQCEICVQNDNELFANNQDDLYEQDTAHRTALERDELSEHAAALSQRGSDRPPRAVEELEAVPLSPLARGSSLPP